MAYFLPWVAAYYSGRSPTCALVDALKREWDFFLSILEYHYY